MKKIRIYEWQNLLNCRFIYLYKENTALVNVKSFVVFITTSVVFTLCSKTCQEYVTNIDNDFHFHLF